MQEPKDRFPEDMMRLPEQDRSMDAAPPQRYRARTRLLVISLAVHLGVLAAAALIFESLPVAPGPVADAPAIIAVDLVALAGSAPPAVSPAAQTPLSQPDSAPEPEPVSEPALRQIPVPDPVPTAQPTPAAEPEARPSPSLAPAVPASPAQPSAQQPPAPRTAGQPAGQRAGPAVPNSATAASRAAKASYAQLLLARLQRAIIYPRGARRRGIEGVVRVEVVLAASGALRSVRLAQTSGQAVLDDAALALVRRVAPFPPVPQVLAPGGADFAFVTPIQYLLN